MTRGTAPQSFSSSFFFARISLATIALAALTLSPPAPALAQYGGHAGGGGGGGHFGGGGGSFGGGGGHPSGGSHAPAPAPPHSSSAPASHAVAHPVPLVRPVNTNPQPPASSTNVAASVADAHRAAILAAGSTHCRLRRSASRQQPDVLGSP